MWNSFLSAGGDDPFKGLIDSFRSNSTNPPLCHENASTPILSKYGRHIRCSPSPDAFNPCDDVMGSTGLRIFCWAIALLALIGNTLQIIVLYTNSQSMTVYKCFMYHLAIANLVMGIYLLILSSLDAYTYGKYYNFVQGWQFAGGCKVAGFLAIFSSELSICLLAFITLERYLLIVHALNVSHQMRLVHARIVLALIYTYSVTIASLPLTDHISSYSKVAICLPFETGESLSKGYVLWLLSFNAIVFLYVTVSYLRMYHQVLQSNRGMGTNNDVEVAKRMAMIVFSNFACWMPISVSGFVTMYTDLPLNIDTSKFLLVFIFPINACTNPFLYAFFTKIFKEDVLFLLNKFGIFRERFQRSQHDRVPYRRTRSRPRSCDCTNNSELSYRGSENKTVFSSSKDSNSGSANGLKRGARESTSFNEKLAIIAVDVKDGSYSSSSGMPLHPSEVPQEGYEMTTVLCHQTHEDIKSKVSDDLDEESKNVSDLNFGILKSNWRLTSLDGSLCDVKDEIELTRLRSVSQAFSLNENQTMVVPDTLDVISPTTQISNLEVE